MATSYNLQCSICLENYKQPKFLDCFHTFCLECLRGLENKTPAFINCPLCSKVSQLPPGGVDKLTTNLYLQNTPLIGVEGGETVTIGGGRLQKSIHGDTQSVGGSWLEGRHQAVNDVNGVSEWKTIQMHSPDTFGITTESFGSVSFDFRLIKNNTYNWGATMALRMSKAESPFVLSCEVEYDITLVNQKDKRFSTKRTGHGNLQTFTNRLVDLIQMRYATDSLYGFIECIDGDKYFKLDIGITFSNINYIDFNLK